MASVVLRYKINKQWVEDNEARIWYAYNFLFLETTLFKFILINFKTQAYLIMGNTKTSSIVRLDNASTASYNYGKPQKNIIVT